MDKVVNNPLHTSTLWPTLTAAQRYALLGDAHWIAFDLTHRLSTYKCVDEESKTIKTAQKLQFNEEQWSRYDAAPVVGSLVEKMIAADGVVNENVIERLYQHLRDAGRQGLRRENRRLYAMTLIYTGERAGDAPEWKNLIERVRKGETTIREGLMDLPPTFWNPQIN